MLAELARGGGGPAAIRYLTAARRSRTMLLVRAIRELAAAVGHAHAGPTGQAYSALMTVQRSAPEAVEALLATPAVGAWAMATARALIDGDVTSARPGLLAAVAAAAAVRGAVPLTITLPPPGGARVVLPSVGVATLAGSAGGIRFRSTGTAASLQAAATGAAVHLPADPAADAGGWHGVPTLTARSGGLELAVRVEGLDWLGDTGPERLGAGELSAADRRCLVAGWQRLVRNHPTVAAEVAAGINTLVPLAAAPAAQHSITFQDGFGCVAMTPPSEPTWAALTLAHEIQHAKLSVITDLVQLTRPGTGTYYAPWRTDSRPLDNLIHGLYAHLGVAAFWRRESRSEPDHERRHRADVEFSRWRAACQQAVATVRRSGRLTGSGERFVDGMESALSEWSTDRVPATAAAAARELACRHRARWQHGTADGGTVPG
jgi:HEXXH motif-containing protein